MRFLEGLHDFHLAVSLVAVILDYTFLGFMLEGGFFNLDVVGNLRMKSLQRVPVPLPLDLTNWWCWLAEVPQASSSVK